MLRPDEAEIEAVAKEFNLHALAVEDTVNAHQRPKLEQLRRRALRGAAPRALRRPAGGRRDRRGPPVPRARLRHHRAARRGARPRRGAHAGWRPTRSCCARARTRCCTRCWTRSSTTTGRCWTGCRTTSTRSRCRSSTATRTSRERIYQLSREVIEFQRAVDPLADLFDALRATPQTARRRHRPGAAPGNLRDVADHATRVIERLAGFRELLTNILQVNAALVGQRQNDGDGPA